MKIESLNNKLQAKLSHCVDIINRAGRLAIGFSGGVDSALLLALATRTLGSENILAVTATGLFHPEAETQSARQFADKLGVDLVEINFDNLDDQRVLDNPKDRCYWCKQVIFKEIASRAKAKNINAVASGANLDDLNDYRPGSRAENELNIIKPLQQAGLTKSDIREISQAMNLDTADKPSKACLASRVPYGVRLDKEILARIEKAEQGIIELGFPQCRVRDHGTVARVEVPASQLVHAFELRDKIVKIVKQVGYNYATLDLEGFRSGAMNETLDLKTGSAN